MASMAQRLEDSFDPKIASSMVASSESVGGIPGYLGVRIRDASPGRMVATLEVREDLHTPFGNLHGGVMAALVDHVLGCVFYPHMPPGQWAATTEFKLNYLAAVQEGELEAVATIESLARRTGVARIEVRNGSRLACLAQGTVLIVAPGGAPSAQR